MACPVPNGKVSEGWHGLSKQPLGLQLTVGALILVAAVWLFGAIAEDVLTGDPLVILDQRVAVWLQAHATQLLTASPEAAIHEYQQLQLQ